MSRQTKRKALFGRLDRQVGYATDPRKSRRERTRASRYAASLAERLGMLRRPALCESCHRRIELERHHRDHDYPLEVTYLCRECHQLADSLATIGEIA